MTQDLSYQIFATVTTFYGPLVAILILYWQIFMTARNRLRRRMAEKAQVKMSASVRNGAHNAHNVQNNGANGHLATAATIDPASNQVQTVVVDQTVVECHQLPPADNPQPALECLQEDSSEAANGDSIETARADEGKVSAAKLNHSLSVDSPLCNGAITKASFVLKHGKIFLILLWCFEYTGIKWESAAS